MWIHSVDSMTLGLTTPLYSVKQMKAYDCIYLSTHLNFFSANPIKCEARTSGTLRITNSTEG